MKNSILLIASGGLDSTVLYHYLGKPDIISFSYGSKHNAREREKLKENIQTSIMEINIDLTHLESSLLSGDIPEGHYEAENMRSTVVPFRNGIMLAYAVSIADSRNLKQVAIGNHGGDHYIYPDCRPTFIGAMNEAAAYGTESNVNIVSPFLRLSKGEIVAIGIGLGIEQAMFNSWTCYNGRQKHCGKCGACTERREAFALNNLKDETEYE